jgi:hypothetical protein
VTRKRLTPKGQLRQPAPFLKRLNDEPRVGTVGRGSDDCVPGSIQIDRYVGGRILKVGRLGTEGNGMRENWSLVIPFDRLTGMDSDILVGKAHSRDGNGSVKMLEKQSGVNSRKILYHLK